VSSLPRGGKGKGYGFPGDDARRCHARCGKAAGASGVRHRAGRGAGPGHAHVGGLDVPALRQQAGTGAGGARLHREAAELPDGRGLPAAARQAGGGLRPGIPRLLVGAGRVGAEAAGPLHLHLPALARARVRAALAAGPRASGGGSPDCAAVEWGRDTGRGARGAGEGRERGGAGPWRRPGRRGAGMGRVGGVGAHGGPARRAGGGSRGARLGPGSLARPGARRGRWATRLRYAFPRRRLRAPRRWRFFPRRRLWPPRCWHSFPWRSRRPTSHWHTLHRARRAVTRDAWQPRGGPHRPR